jgi:hypothetical protein
MRLNVSLVKSVTIYFEKIPLDTVLCIQFGLLTALDKWHVDGVFDLVVCESGTFLGNILIMESCYQGPYDLFGFMVGLCPSQDEIHMLKYGTSSAF